VANAELNFGIDLGGTKIELLALDGTGAECWRRRVPTPQGDYAGTLEAVAGLVLEAERALGVAGTVGIGIPGSPSPTSGLIRNANSTVLNGKPLQQDLERLLERQVRLANDANCFALSEATDGAAAGAEIVFGVIVGTGTGGGIVVRGDLLTGRNAIAGEWGHNPLPWPHAGESPGPACWCGKRGCIETWLSGPGMLRDHLRYADEELSPEEIAARAAAGDAGCERTLRRYEDRLARGLAHIITVLDPDVIVLGGGMSNIARLYENVPRLWPRYVFSDNVTTELRPPRYGDSSGVRGAAWLGSKSSGG
jgi:fructokinase